MAVPAKFREKAVLFTDVAVNALQDELPKIQKNNCTMLHYISVGRLDGWRGFDLLIEAFAEALKTYPGMCLSILGDGAEKRNLNNLIAQKDLGRKVTLLGNVSKEEYNRIISTCDVVVNSCLKEGAVTVSFDSMRYGKPLICIDSGGFTRFFPRITQLFLLSKEESLLFAP